MPLFTSKSYDDFSSHLESNQTLLIMTYKPIYELAPRYLYDLISQNFSFYLLLQTLCFFSKIPSISPSQGICTCCFMWNILPDICMAYFFFLFKFSLINLKETFLDYPIKYSMLPIALYLLVHFASIYSMCILYIKKNIGLINLFFIMSPYQ